MRRQAEILFTKKAFYDIKDLYPSIVIVKFQRFIFYFTGAVQIFYRGGAGRRVLWGAGHEREREV
jgi:hypothetical protein